MTNLKHQDNTLLICKITMGSPGGSAVMNLQFDPWVGKIPEGGNGRPLQYSCLENPMDRGAWWATVHGVAKELDMTEQLNNTYTTVLP